MVETSRRTFLGGAISLLAASTFVPLPSMANLSRIYADGVRDDTYGLGALFRREPVIFPQDKLGVDEHKGIVLHNVQFKLTRTVEIPDDVHIERVGVVKFNLLDLDESLYALRGSAQALTPFVGLFTTWYSYRGGTKRRWNFETEKYENLNPPIPALGVPNRRLYMDTVSLEGNGEAYSPGTDTCASWNLDHTSGHEMSEASLNFAREVEARRNAEFEKMYKDTYS